MPSLLCLVLGTRGDVQPVALLASSLVAEQDFSVTLVTHAAHEVWLHELLEHAGISVAWIDAPPAGRWDQQQANEGKSKRKRAQVDAVPTGLGPYREELVRAVEGIIGSAIPLPPGCRARQEALVPEAVVANLLCLEGYHIAEALGCKLIMASPYQVPYGCPSSFERRFSSAFPDLFDLLAGGARHAATAGCKGTGRSLQALLQDSEPKDFAPWATCEAQRISWIDVEHWMWPLFTERWGGWRTSRLGLPSIPLTSQNGNPVDPLPPAPLLLYGFSEFIVPRPGYWPDHFISCGFWVQQKDRHKGGPVGTGSDLDGSSQHLVSMAIARASSSSTCLSDPSLEHQGLVQAATSLPPVLVDFGGMGAMGLLGNPRHLVATLVQALSCVGRDGILLSGGWEPLEAACRIEEEQRAKREDADSRCRGQARLGCLRACPHGMLMPGCSAVVHHGGSGTTAAALIAGIPQVICPLQFDQHFWAERMAWLGLAPEPLEKSTIFRPEGSTAEELLSSGKAGNSSQQAASTVLQDALKKALSPEAREAAQTMQQRLVAELQANGGHAVVRATRLVARYLQVTANNLAGDSLVGREEAAQNAGTAHSLQAAGLPPGYSFRCFGREEASSIENELLIDCVYLRHGIRVGPDDIVVDVGANIGLFCLLMLAGPQMHPGALGSCSGELVNDDECEKGQTNGHGCWHGPPAVIHAFEPVPPIFEALMHNVKQLEACSLSKSGQVKVSSIGLGKAPDPAAVFTFYPGMAGNSTQHPGMKAHQYARMNPAIRDACFASPASFTARVETLSNLMRQHDIEHIDLLKIDVEGSEEDVLAGILDTDWPKIKQIVVEVNEDEPYVALANSATGRVIALLKSKGMFTNVTAEPCCSNAGNNTIQQKDGRERHIRCCNDANADAHLHEKLLPSTNFSSMMTMVYASRQGCDS